MAIQDVKRAAIMPLFGAGTPIEEQVARLQRYYSQMAQELVEVHNSIQTGIMTGVTPGLTVFVFVWQTPWPIPPSYKPFAAFNWQTTYTFARAGDGRSTTFTTAVGSPAGFAVVVLGVA